jgi:hypothetical protein
VQACRFVVADAGQSWAFPEFVSSTLTVLRWAKGSHTAWSLGSLPLSIPSTSRASPSSNQTRHCACVWEQSSPLPPGWYWMSARPRAELKPSSS